MTRSGVERAAAYRSTMDAVALVANLIENVDLDDALEIARSADTIGPMLLPTEWARGNRNTEDAKALLVPLIAFRAEARKIRDRAAAEHIAR